MAYIDEVIADVNSGVFRGEYLDTPEEPHMCPPPDNSGFILGVAVGALLF